MRKTQVVIIGAGPTGLSLALQLQRYNIDFLLLEKNEKTTELSKAVVVQARSLEIFRELGLSAIALEQGKITTAMNLFYDGKRKAHIDLAGMGSSISPFPFALSLEQSKTEKLLAGKLYEKGGKVNWRCSFSRIEEEEHSATVIYQDEEGREEQVVANYVVGCDGAGSLLRHQLGLSFDGDTVAKIFYVADVRLTSDVINKNELFIFLIPKGFVIFFPMEGERHYRMIGILPEAHAEEQFSFKDVEAIVKPQLSVTVNFEQVTWFSTYKVHSRMAENFSKGRCFIAGDAAHIHTPAGGQGMNTGIQDAYNLAWKLALTLNKETSPAILETYYTERHENARHLLHTTDRMFDLMAGTTGWRNFIRLHIVPLFAGFITSGTLVKKKIFPLISQTSISYDQSGLTIKSVIGHIHAGPRMPWFIFKDGTDILETLKNPSFKLLFFGNKNVNRSKLFGGLKLKLLTLSFEEIPEALFGHESDFYILLRPDNHISYIGKRPELCLELLVSYSND